MPTKNSQNWRKKTEKEQLALQEKGKKDAERFAKQKPDPYTRGGQ